MASSNLGSFTSNPGSEASQSNSLNGSKGAVAPTLFLLGRFGARAVMRRTPRKPLWLLFKAKVGAHAGFLAEALVEAVPQCALQTAHAVLVGRLSAVGAASILYHYGRSLAGVDPPADAALP